MIPELYIIGGEVYMIISIFVGIIFLVFAYLVGEKKKINIIHLYHYRNVKEEDKPAYCKEFGKGLSIIGISSVMEGILECWSKIEWTGYLYWICICYAFYVFHKAQMKYNDGKWFSF